MPLKHPFQEAAQKARVGFLYFSGAGNTECLTHIFERVFTSQGCEVVFCERITRHLDPLKLGDNELLGVGVPVYFRRAPQIVYDTIALLDGLGKQAFVFCTKGMYSGNVCRSILEQCRSAGFTPIGSLEVHMPGSDLLLFTKKDSLSEKIVKGMRSKKIGEKVRNFVTTVLNDGKPSVPGSKWYTFIDEKGITPLERLFTKDYQIFRGKYRVLQERCTECLLCVRDCPEENIRFENGKIVFGNTCDLCLRCIHHCPTEAIQLGNKTLKAPRYWPQPTEDGDCRPR